MQIQVKNLNTVQHPQLTFQFGGLASGQSSATCTWLAALRVGSRSSVIWSWMRFEPLSIADITQLFSFPAGSKNPSLYFQIFTCLSLPYLYFYPFFFLIQAFCLHEELLFWLTFCSLMTLSLQVRVRQIPSLPSCQYISAVLFASREVQPLSCFWITFIAPRYVFLLQNFSKCQSFYTEHILSLIKW